MYSNDNFEKPIVAKEPVAEYSVNKMGENNLLSDKLFIDAVRYAIIEREQKRMIPHKEVYGLLAAKLGRKSRQ